MRLYVTAQVIGEDGTPVWGFLKEEQLPLPRKDQDADDWGLAVSQRLLDAIDEAKESVAGQIAAEQLGRED